MKIKLITVGKVKQSYWRQAEQDFLSRIKHYINLDQVVVKDAVNRGAINDDLVKAKEAKAITEKIAADEFLVALSETGQQLRSDKFAAFFQDKMNRGITKVTFVIGGPLGLSQALLKDADTILSLSKMTLPHEMAKVVLLEQIYRAMTILRQEKYHK